MQKKTSQSPLHLIASDKNHTEENNKIKDIIDLLIKYGADIEQYVDGETPLLTATNDRNTIAIESLLRHGADPLMEDDYNHTFFEALKSPGRWSSWGIRSSYNWFKQNYDLQRFIMEKWGGDYSHFKEYISPIVSKEFPEFSESDKLGLL